MERIGIRAATPEPGVAPNRKHSGVSGVAPNAGSATPLIPSS